MSPAEHSGAHREEHVLREELEGGVLRLTLSRGSRRNALAVTTVGQLADHLQAPTDCRAVVITGEPPAFCAGGDLTDLQRVAEGGALEVTDTVYRNFHRLVRTLVGLERPVVAAVNGPALGAGLDLALCCDLRVASRSAHFASSWIAMGLVPGMAGARHLAAAVGTTRAAEMLLLGGRVDADRALAWGLVNEVCDDDDLAAYSLELARRLAALPASATSRTKAALRRAVGPLDDELAVLGATQGGLLVGDDFRSAAKRFARPPQPEESRS